MFIHFRNYTQYSLSRGALKIDDLVKFCNKNHIPAIGISDFGNLFGTMEFSLACIKSGIQPILSCNIRIEDENHSNGKYYSNPAPSVEANGRQTFLLSRFAA